MSPDGVFSYKVLRRESAKGQNMDAVTFVVGRSLPRRKIREQQAKLRTSRGEIKKNLQGY